MCASDLTPKVESIPKDDGSLASSTFTYTGLTTTVVGPPTAHDPAGQKTISTKNVIGQVIKVTDNIGGFLLYTYDADGNLATTRHSSWPASLSISMTYDQRGRKTAMNDPDLGYWSYRYSGFGELVKQTSPNGVTIMSYDALGRLVQRSEPEGTSTWQYDAISGLDAGKSIGKLIRSTAPSAAGGATHTLLYDSLGRPWQETTVIDGSSYITQTTYDDLGRVSGTRYPSGFATYNVYNNYGFLTEIHRDNASGVCYWQAQTWNADGSVLKEQQGNVITTRAYQPGNGRLKSIQTGPGGGASLLNLGYTFDTLGNLTQRTDGAKTENFTYDGLNRLYDATASGTGVTAGMLSTRYDLGGNIVSKTGMSAYSYGDTARPNRLTGLGTQGFSYDVCGNMQQIGGRTVAWTSYNMVSQITGNSGSMYAGVSAAFSYDAEHSRVKQVSVGQDGLSTTTIYVGGYEKITRGMQVEQRHHIDGPTGPIAIYSLKSQWVEDLSLIFKDHLGSIVLLTDWNGMPHSGNSFSFDAWGKRRDPSSYDNSGLATNYVSRDTAKTTHGFTGHEELDDLGLVHMNGRIYNPEIGRMLSADPFVGLPYNTQGYGRYTYVLNQPLTATDPSGYFSWGNIIGAVVAVVAGIVTAGVAWAAYAAAIGAYGGSFSAALAAAAFGAAGATALGGGVAAFGGAVVAGAGFGFGSAFAGTLYAGGSLGQALHAGAIGALVGAVSAGVSFGIANVAQRIGGLGGYGFNEVGNDLLGNAMTAATGGSFEKGLLSSAFSNFLAPPGQPGTTAERVFDVAYSAAVGGTTAEIGGGKFENGATTAAFEHLFNNEAYHAESKDHYNIGGFIGDIAGKIWALPDTVIGLAWGAVGLLVDNITGVHAMNVTFGHNAIQFENHPWAGTAETIGNTISYSGGDYSPDSFDRYEQHTIGQHEMQHTFQSQQLGPLYLPAVALSYLASAIFDGPTAYYHGPSSFMERGPQTIGPNNRPWNFSNSYNDPYAYK